MLATTFQHAVLCVESNSCPCRKCEHRRLFNPL